MKKILFVGIVIAMIGVIAIGAKSGKNETEVDTRIVKLEKLAEKGDTAAMHRLIEFYDENSV